MYDFPLVINTNLPPILHRFQVMADYMSNFASRFMVTCPGVHLSGGLLVLVHFPNPNPNPNPNPIDRQKSVNHNP